MKGLLHICLSGWPGIASHLSEKADAHSGAGSRKKQKNSAASLIIYPKDTLPEHATAPIDTYMFSFLPVLHQYL